MKKIQLKVTAIALATLFMAFTACNNEDTKSTEKPKKEQSGKNALDLPNYRYVDIDTILSKYNLAKDYNEEMLRMQTSMESQAKRHQNELQSKAGAIQNKLQNNGYLSEASYNQDQKELAGLQEKAQRNLANLQNNFESSAMQAQQAVNDSIVAFIKEYNKKRGYDAIFMKNVTLYINPALDITEEIVEGLNARYNKVNKK